MTSTDFLGALFETLARRLAGEAVSATRLPPVRFPSVPAPPLGPAVPADTQQRHWRQFLRAIPTPAGDARLLDFGCGAADRRGEVEQAGYAWHGLDISGSAESRARRDGANITLYDGLEVPLPSASFGVVLSTQTFEHVADPRLTFGEISRLLIPRGFLVGSTSHLEPYHSNSTFTFTPHVFAELLASNGLAAQQIAPGIDGFTLLTRRLMRQFGEAEAARSLNGFFAEPSPLNQLLDEAGELQGIDPQRINALKLELVGQFHFLAQKRA